MGAERVWDGVNWDGAVLCNLHEQNYPPEMLSALRGGTAEMLLSQLLLQTFKAASPTVLPPQQLLGLPQSHQTEKAFLYVYVCVHVKMH